MQYVEKAQAELDKYAQNLPELVKVCKKYNVPPGLVLGGVSVVFTLGLLLYQGYNIVCAILTCVYPMI